MSHKGLSWKEWGTCSKVMCLSERRTGLSLILMKKEELIAGAISNCLLSSSVSFSSQE